MTENELRAMSKLELLEMLRRQELEIEQLSAGREGETRQPEAPIRPPEMQRVAFERAGSGSLDDASTVFTGVMRAAQDAADVYLQNIKNLEAEKTAIIEKLEQEKIEKAAHIYTEAERRRHEAEEEAKRIFANTKRFLDWHTAQLATMRAGFRDAVSKMGMADIFFAEDSDAQKIE